MTEKLKSQLTVAPGYSLVCFMRRPSEPRVLCCIFRSARSPLPPRAREQAYILVGRAVGHRVELLPHQARGGTELNMQSL